MINTNIELNFKDFPASIQIIANDRLTGDAAALRGNMLNLVIDNLNQLVIEPLQEVCYK